MTASPDVPFSIAAKGWPLPQPRSSRPDQDRAVEALVTNHTLIVGQSRSGKTNALRRLIEEILTWTSASLVILDPNADFKLLGQVSSDCRDRVFARRWRSVAKHIEVISPGTRAWGIRWADLSFEEMAAYLRLNPKETFAEYRHLERHYQYEKEAGRLASLEEFLASKYLDLASGESLERYRVLLEALAVREIWADRSTATDLVSALRAGHRAVVVDLSKDDEEVRAITVARTLETLWLHGEEKRRAALAHAGGIPGGGAPWDGTLVVIEEAHLFAPPSTDDPRKRAVCDRIERLADQGKKLNLHLLAVTQQPGKLHRGVLAECDNRIVLRVNERLSLTLLEDVYGGMKGRYDGTLTFKLGEALLEGALLCDETPFPALPRGVRFELARTREGGGTPSKDWATCRDPW